MEIRFCSVCNESIPDGEFDAGRAIVSGARSQHVACALKRSVEMSGWRSWLTFLLALFAAGVATYLLVVKLGEPKEPPEPTRVAKVVEEHVAEAVRASEARSGAALAEQDRQSQAELLELLDTRLAEHDASLKQAATRAIDEQVRRAEKEVGERIRTIDLAVAKLQQQMADLVDWKIRIQAEADQLRRELELAKRRQPTNAGPTPPAQPVQPKPPAPAPKPDAERLKEIERWRERLKDPDEDIVFSATIELARLKALEATPDLLEVLNKHKDFYARLGAATALGEIRACDAVPDLVEALNDRDDLVRTAAAEALQRITEQDFDFVSGLGKNERIRIQKKWRVWWRDNEEALRAKLGQPKT